MRVILDRPDLLDVINIHNLGDPYEIEHQSTWLHYETAIRKYTKPIIISDTIPTSYIAWGPATTCKGRGLGVVIPPATEQDRCELAHYFTKLVNKDKKTLTWTREFVAADHVQKTIIAAEQGIALINLSFTIDLPFLTAKFMQASAGISAWAGALKINFNGKVTEKRPLYYSIQQLMSHFNNYDKVERIPHHNDQARIYKITRNNSVFWIAWYNANKVVLPENYSEGIKVFLPMSATKFAIEELTTSNNAPKRSYTSASNGNLDLQLSHKPIYIPNILKSRSCYKKFKTSPMNQHQSLHLLP